MTARRQSAIAVVDRKQFESHCGGEACKQTEQAAERAGRRGIMLHDTARPSGHINPVEQTQRQQQGKLILNFCTLTEALSTPPLLAPSRCLVYCTTALRRVKCINLLGPFKANQSW